MTKFKEIVLDEVLELDSNKVQVSGLESYEIAGVYGYGRGLFKRESISGLETTYKNLHVLSENQIVLSQLKGWEGAIARVTEDFHGWFLSPQFPTFKTKSNNASVEYIEWFCRHPQTWEKLKQSSHGLGARRDTVKPDSFLKLKYHCLS